MLEPKAVMLCLTLYDLFRINAFKGEYKEDMG